MRIERLVLIFAGYRPERVAGKISPFDQAFRLIAKRHTRCRGDQGSVTQLQKGEHYGQTFLYWRVGRSLCGLCHLAQISGALHHR